MLDVLVLLELLLVLLELPPTVVVVVVLERLVVVVVVVVGGRLPGVVVISTRPQASRRVMISPLGPVDVVVVTGQLFCACAAPSIAADIANAAIAAFKKILIFAAPCHLSERQGYGRRHARGTVEKETGLLRGPPKGGPLASLRRARS